MRYTDDGLKNGEERENMDKKLTIDEDFIKNYFKELEEGTKRKEQLIAEDGESIYNRVFAVVEKDGGLHDESLVYRPEEFDVTEEEFHALEEFILNHAAEEDGFEDQENEFDHVHYRVSLEGKEMDLFVMWGQGRCAAFREVDERLVAPRTILFEEVLRSLRESE